jgi:uncharacterized protein YndB with AHSA1/START domain
MTDAKLITDADRPAVRLERLLPDPPKIVWQAITDRDQLKSWFPCDVIVDAGGWQVGATLTFPFPAEAVDMTLTGEVLAVDQPHLLSYTWGEETLQFELAEHDAGTRLVLINVLAPGAAARNAAGWDDCLDRLLGATPAPDSWRTRFATYSAAFEPTLGHQEGPPAGYKG